MKTTVLYRKETEDDRDIQHVDEERKQHVDVNITEEIKNPEVTSEQQDQREASVEKNASKRSRIKTPRRETIIIYPKAGDRIAYQERDGEDWKSLEITGRGGKSTSKLNRDYFNAKTSDG